MIATALHGNISFPFEFLLSFKLKHTLISGIAFAILIFNTNKKMYSQRNALRYSGEVVSASILKHSIVQDFRCENVRAFQIRVEHGHVSQPKYF